MPKLIELFPVATPAARVKLRSKRIGNHNANFVRRRFESGMKFFDQKGRPHTIADIVPGRTIILHCSAGAKLQIGV